MTRIFLAALALACLAVPADAQQAAPQPVRLFEGDLNLPVIDGLAVSSDCLGFKFELAGNTPAECLHDHVGAMRGHVAAYVALLKQQGYLAAGEAGPAIWVHKPNAGGGCDRVTLSRTWDYRTIGSNPRDEDPGVILILHAARTICVPAIAP